MFLIYRILFICILICSCLVGKSQAEINILELETKLRTYKSEDNIIKTNLKLSNLYIASDLDKAKKYATNALNISINTNSINDQVLSSRQLGKIELIKLNYQEALEFYLKSSSLNKNNSNIKQHAVDLILIGDVYKEIGDFKRTKNQYFKALNIGKKTKSNHIKAIANFALGKVEEQENNKFLALEYYILSNQQIAQTSKIELKGEIAHYLGIFYFNVKRFSSAEIHLLEALNIYEKLKIKEKQAILNYELGQLYENLENNGKALIYLKNSLNLSEETGMKTYIKRGYEDMAKVYETKKDYKRAYEFLQYYAAIKDVSEINELETKLNLAKKNQELIFLEEQDKNKEKIRNLQLTFLIIFLVILIIFSGFLYFAYRQKSSINIKLIKANERANQLRKDKEDFFAYTSHEIRTPLNAVVGLSQLVSETNLNQKQQKYIKTINSSANSILFLVNDILDLSKIEKGAIELENVPFSLKEITEDIVQTLLFKAEKNDIIISSDINNNIPELNYGDPVRLNQILLNLADNAIKFTHKGEVKIILSLISSDKHSSKIKFTIKDTGIGIKKDKLNSIFESYSQESSDTTRQYGGTGLGLAISKELVSLMNGNLQVDSAYGVGSSFYFTITMQNGNAKDVKTSLKPSQEIILSDIKILLVDDNELNRNVFYDLINNTKNNVSVDLAEDGEIAIKKLIKNNYDIILMDIQMPNKNGYETTIAIRQDFKDGKQNIPIIAMTAYVLEGVLDKCLASGMNDCISKPIKRELLNAKINSVLNINSTTKIDEKIKDENKSKNTSSSIIDLSLIKDISNNNNEKILKYINLYLDKVPEDFKKIKTCIKNSDYNKIAELAHKIKGNAGYLGVNSAFPYLEKLENIKKNSDKSNNIVSIVSNLEEILEKSFNELMVKRKQYN